MISEILLIGAALVVFPVAAAVLYLAVLIAGRQRVEVVVVKQGGRAGRVNAGTADARQGL